MEEIKANFNLINQSILAGAGEMNGDQRAVALAASEILEGIATNLHRIADRLEGDQTLGATLVVKE